MSPRQARQHAKGAGVVFAVAGLFELIAGQADEVIVLDDFGAVLKSDGALQILLSALEHQTSRDRSRVVKYRGARMPHDAIHPDQRTFTETMIMANEHMPNTPPLIRFDCPNRAASWPGSAERPRSLASSKNTATPPCNSSIATREPWLPPPCWPPSWPTRALHQRCQGHHQARGGECGQAA